jgi:hypothetical protein
MPDLTRVVQNYRGPSREIEVLKDPAHDFIDTDAHYIDVASDLDDTGISTTSTTESSDSARRVWIKWSAAKGPVGPFGSLRSRDAVRIVAGGGGRHPERRPPTERIGAPVPVRNTG